MPFVLTFRIQFTNRNFSVVDIRVPMDTRTISNSLCFEKLIYRSSAPLFIFLDSLISINLFISYANLFNCYCFCSCWLGRAVGRCGGEIICCTICFMQSRFFSTSQKTSRRVLVRVRWAKPRIHNWKPFNTWQQQQQRELQTNTQHQEQCSKNQKRKKRFCSISWHSS